MNEPPPRLAVRFAVTAVLMTWGSACVVWLWADRRTAFVWSDVAVVYILCALPAAWAVAAALRHRASAASCAVLALLALSALAVPRVVSPVSGAAGRVAFGLVLALPPTLAVAAMRRGTSGGGIALVGLAAAALLLPPASYVAARLLHDTGELRGLVGQSRFAEARDLAKAMAGLDPGLLVDGEPVIEVAAALSRRVTHLEAEARRPLPQGATVADRVARGRALAMLGRTAEALAALPTGHDPEADGLRATILETRGEWESGLGAYQDALRGWLAQPPSRARASGEVRATAGVAYCLRKLGRYREAEAAYRQLLKAAPTADHYFLLAQFYEDTQQADRARTFARHAIALAPDHYRQRGEKMIARLVVHQFGCLGVFAAEWRRGKGSMP